MTRAKQANESSETDPKESKHGEDLYQSAGGSDRSYAIDFKGGQNFGEGQGKTSLRHLDEKSCRLFVEVAAALFETAAAG